MAAVCWSVCINQARQGTKTSSPMRRGPRASAGMCRYQGLGVLCKLNKDIVSVWSSVQLTCRLLDLCLCRWNPRQRTKEACQLPAP